MYIDFGMVDGAPVVRVVATEGQRQRQHGERAGGAAAGGVEHVHMPGLCVHGQRQGVCGACLPEVWAAMSGGR